MGALRLQEQAYLDACRPALEAEDRLRAGDFEDWEIEKLVLAITGDAEKARQAYEDRVHWRSARGEKFKFEPGK